MRHLHKQKFSPQAAPGFELCENERQMSTFTGLEGGFYYRAILKNFPRPEAAFNNLYPMH
jgi:hypothetical protein